MGYSISWLACKGPAREDILSRLGLAATGAQAGFADEEFTGQTLPGGWYLLVTRGCDHPVIAPSSLATLSTDGEVVACSIEEHVMFSGAARWRDGKKIWDVRHQGDRRVTDLAADGELPAEFDEIRKLYAEKQAAEDLKDKFSVDWYFEIPLALAKGLVGFKHDEGGSGDFEVLAPVAGAGTRPARKSRWRFW